MYTIFNLTGSGMGSNYLTFLDLGLQTNIFRNVDDSSREVRLPSSFNIGRSTYHILYVRLLVICCDIILAFSLI